MWDEASPWEKCNVRTWNRALGQAENTSQTHTWGCMVLEQQGLGTNHNSQLLPLGREPGEGEGLHNGEAPSEGWDLLRAGTIPGAGTIPASQEVG